MPFPFRNHRSRSCAAGRHPSPQSLAVVLTAVLGLAACSKEPAETPSSPPTVMVAEVRQAPPFAVRFSGRLRASDRSDLSFEVGGRIAAMHAELGARVERGALLAELDERPFRLDLESRRADLRSAEAALREARVDLERHRRLLSTGAVSQARFDRARTRAETETARVDALAAAVEQAEERHVDSRIRAPYDGEIAARLAEPGEVAAAGQPVLRLIDRRAGLEAVVHVPGDVAARVGDDEQARIFHPRLPRPLAARVTERGREANAAGLFPLTVRLQAASPVGPGESVDVGFQATERAPLKIPLSSFVPLEAGRARVFVVDQAGERAVLSERVIELRALRGDGAEVIAGLEPGEGIAARGVEFLADGQVVVPVGTGIARYNR